MVAFVIIGIKRKLLTKKELKIIWSLRDYLNRQNLKEPIEAVIEVMRKTKNNKQFLDIISHLEKNSSIFKE